MFGQLKQVRHLKNEEFIEIVENDSTSSTQQAHLASCSECEFTLKATAAVHMEFAAIDADVVEPDWEDFRTSVRNGLLSRSVQRQSIVRRWTGLKLRSSFALALSLLIVTGLATGGFVWHIEHDFANSAQAKQSAKATAAVVPAVYIDSSDPTAIETEGTAWSHNDAFEDLSQVGDAQEAKLQQLIQSALSAPNGSLELQ